MEFKVLKPVQVGDIVFFPNVIAPIDDIAYEDDWGYAFEEPHLFFQGDGEDDYFTEDEIIWDSRNDTIEDLIAMLKENGIKWIYRKKDYVELMESFVIVDNEPSPRGYWISADINTTDYPILPDEVLVNFDHLVQEVKNAVQNS